MFLLITSVKIEDPEPEIQSETEAEPETQSESETETESESESETEPEPETKPEPKPDTEPEGKAVSPILTPHWWSLLSHKVKYLAFKVNIMCLICCIQTVFFSNNQQKQGSRPEPLSRKELACLGYLKNTKSI